MHFGQSSIKPSQDGEVKHQNTTQPVVHISIKYLLLNTCVKVQQNKAEYIMFDGKFSFTHDAAAADDDADDM